MSTGTGLSLRLSGASDEEGRRCNITMRYGNIYACMSWSWRSQSLRHVPRPKNIISSHSGILDAFVAASLCLSVSPCCSFVLVVESVGQALFNPSLLFIKKRKKKKKNISVPGWYLHEFENPLLRCRALCLSSPSSMKEEQANAFLSVCTETSSESNRLQLAIFWPRG